LSALISGALVLGQRETEAIIDWVLIAISAADAARSATGFTRRVGFGRRQRFDGFGYRQLTLNRTLSDRIADLGVDQRTSPEDGRDKPGHDERAACV
jgi:hypothetical protein